MNEQTDNREFVVPSTALCDVPSNGSANPEGILLPEDLEGAAYIAILPDWVYEEPQGSRETRTDSFMHKSAQPQSVLSKDDLEGAAYIATLPDWVYEDPVSAVEAVQTGGQQTHPPFDLDEHIHIECTGTKLSRKYQLHLKCYSVKVSDLENISFSDIPVMITLILEHILLAVLANVGDKEMVRLRVDSSSLDFPIYTPPILRSQLSVSRWMAEIEKVLQSHQDFVLDDSFTISVQHTTIPSGSCRRKVPELLRRRLQKMRSVVVIKNEDEICLARALIVGKAYADQDKALCSKLRRGEKMLTKLAKELVDHVGLPHREFDITDISKFEAVLSEYQIVVVSVDHANKIVYSGQVRNKQINLLHHNRHFDTLTSLPAFFRRSYWCYSCNKGYDEAHNHRCASRCQQCLRADCEADERNVLHCTDCNRLFYGNDCFEYHKETVRRGRRRQNNCKSICKQVFICKNCNCTVSFQNRAPDNEHRCGETYCKVCRLHVVADEHHCFMKPHVLQPAELERHKNASFIYFDFETYIREDGQLVPNLAVVQNNEGEEWVFPNADEPIGADITDSLCQFLFGERHREHYIIAHNFKGFDGYFILNWLLTNGITPKVILNGGKILQLDVPTLGIRFRDSMNYNPQSLAKWPATFGLPDIEKGTFPHKFNRPGNWNKVTEFPPIQEYGYGSLDQKAQANLKKWYDLEVMQKNNIFDFRKEFVDYCRNDVTVLRMCCQQFRKLFQEISNGLCPFVSALTIAGLCNLYWRSFILKENLIGLVPDQRVPRNRKQSIKAIKWLSWLEETDGSYIESGAHGGEHKIGPYYVDGFIPKRMQVYEFYGCWYHGCPQCTDVDTLHPFRNLPMRDIHQETLEREAYIRARGYSITTIWEHDYDDQLRSDKEMREYVAALTIAAPLRIRDAFYGGRVNAVKLFHQVQGAEKILYYDVMSEYPFVNKNKRYPVGHPIIITKNFKEVREYFGLVHCEILPPPDLYLPVLPFRSNGKLTFPLCRACVDTYQNSACQHTDQERILTGTWCTPEVHRALDVGYTVTKVFEVWHYDQYEDHLFREYIDKFLKIKTESSGWPAGVETEDQKQQYIVDFAEHEGIHLEYDKIQVNAGLRSLSKLCLNSFWGRLGMQDNKLSTSYISDPDKFYEMLLSGEYHVHSWDLFTEEMLQLTYTKESGFVDQNPNTNVVLAAFTTCWARLHLYQFMDMVKDRLLYFDTDSIFFVSRPDSVNPPTGKFLGDLTDELKEGQHIVQFVSLGAKTYAYVTNDGQCVVKIKGFTVNGHTKEILNFSTMLSLLQQHSSVSVPYPDIIQRVKSSLILRNVSLTKRLRVTYDKRRVVDDAWNTLPYGYKTK